MATVSATFQELVSPDGKRKIIPRSNEEDVRYRFQGFLPVYDPKPSKEQVQPTEAKPVAAKSGPKA